MRHRLAILAAALLWSTSGFFVKSPALSAIEPLADRGLLIAGWRSFFAALALVPLILWRWRQGAGRGEDRAAAQVREGSAQRPPQPRGLRRWGLLPLVGSFATMNVMFVAAMTRASAGDVIFLQYMAPLWVLLGSVVWLKEGVARANAGALGLGLAGVAVIVYASAGGSEAVGALLALGAGVAYAGVILSLRALKGEDPLQLIGASLLVSWLVLLPGVLARTDGLTGVQWVWIAALGVVQMAAPYALFAWGLKGVTAQEGALLTLVEPVVNPLWVWLIWGAAIAGHTLVGGGLILAGLAFRYGSGYRAKGAPSPG